MSVAAVLQLFLLYVIVPAWFCAGLADWCCHRACRIEATSGVKESILHIAQLSQVGLPLLAALFFEINALILGSMVAGLILHQATAIWDVHWADATRTIPPVEQHVHSVLEMAPVMAFSGFAILNWPEFTNLLEGRLSLALEPKRDPLPTGYLTAVMVAVVVMGIVPFGEELLRCLRAGRSKST